MATNFVQGDQVVENLSVSNDMRQTKHRTEIIANFYCCYSNTFRQIISERKEIHYKYRAKLNGLKPFLTFVTPCHNAFNAKDVQMYEYNVSGLNSAKKEEEKKGRESTA